MGKSSAMPPPPAPSAWMEEATELATEAGDLTLDWYRTQDLHVITKDDGSPVTEADKAAERLLREHIVERHPDDGVLGEEEGETQGSSGRRWLIDPIDGTASFVRGVPLFATLLAIEDEHGPAVGVIHVPALSETVSAGRGLGCFYNGAPTRVSDRADMAGAIVTTSGYDAWSPKSLARLRQTNAAMRAWGDAYGYVLLVTGRVDVMADPIAFAWDLAPMVVAVTEAGGRFTDLAGTPAYDSGGGLATNGILHDAALSWFVDD